MTLKPHYSLAHALSLLQCDRLLSPEGTACNNVPFYIIQSVLNLCCISGSHSGKYEEYSPLGCNTL
jgi:hypothetical protein